MRLMLTSSAVMPSTWRLLASGPPLTPRMPGVSATSSITPRRAPGPVADRRLQRRERLRQRRERRRDDDDLARPHGVGVGAAVHAAACGCVLSLSKGRGHLLRRLLAALRRPRADEDRQARLGEARRQALALRARPADESNRLRQSARSSSLL